MVPSEIPPNEYPQPQQGTPFYQPPPPAAGYPPPPFGNPYTYVGTQSTTFPTSNPYEVKESKCDTNEQWHLLFLCSCG